ncbi:thiamine phosphate synthase [Staphylococcus condimenti]|uniref:Thiamine phosphate synthase n=2 Tax=Staphylococcus TaxID=1279 RepID=A0AB37GY98_9STAP|nr:thiamine phosphate synthase [Staphylococcus condimenti]OFO99595.1 thiamine phosphate synthase [Staphylococcus sp. HMSC065E08]AMY06207.1 thiamine phosphate synthase [Staphylococcus condimenti]APR60086.1 thiamine phosphate synthase [Staphylococcus condimenti]PNZ64075.1 thiamine phosphate synthase [Staphylococcus condimenti]QQS81993.1 thiamine phosphate synthase [Staphylococcus condimenti]
MYVAITPYRVLTQQDLIHYIEIESVIDTLIFRTPMEPKELINLIKNLMQAGFPKDKITIHTDTDTLQKLDLNAIHFREGDERAYNFKTANPDICVSMSTHNSQSAQAAEAHNLDYILFGHLFQTKSKPGKTPRTNSEIESVLNVNIPVVALGGINADTLSLVPKGFSGIAAISYFREQDLETIRSAKEAE